VVVPQGHDVIPRRPHGGASCKGVIPRRPRGDASLLGHNSMPCGGASLSVSR